MYLNSMNDEVRIKIMDEDVGPDDMVSITCSLNHS